MYSALPRYAKYFCSVLCNMYLNMRIIQFLYVFSHKHLLSSQSCHCSDIRNGFNGKLENTSMYFFVNQALRHLYKY